MADGSRSQQATLGCGTLILIALIVAIFSRPGLGDLEHEVRELRTEVRHLKTAVDDQSAEIRALRQKMEK